ncbi:MAG: SsrA-binding protein [Candidatus Shikimatogenerans sp. JK-2022]|nr:SsrA-binding protein [Candidatus Shikimatogenerans bostrichidophilus]
MINKYEIINKKINYFYNLIKKYNAGLILKGKEVKLIRNKKCNISNSYCKIYKNNIYIYNFKIHNLNLRKIKLLLLKKEILKIYQYVYNKNRTIIPQKIYFSNSGFAKIIIYICIRKKLYDLKKKNKKKEKEQNKKNLKLYY